jgi:hypothetical protein
MKYAKMLGLAAAAAMAVMAFVGASSASATVLCTTNANCTTSHSEWGEMYDSGDVITATATGATLTSSLADITCESSEIALRLTGTGSSSLSVDGETDTFSFTGCETHSFFTGTDPCNDSEGSVFTNRINLGTAPDGTIRFGLPQIKFECPGVINCTFGAGQIYLSLTGGSPAAIVASKLGLTPEGGGFCPENAFLDVTYETTSGSVYVQKG